MAGDSVNLAPLGIDLRSEPDLLRRFEHDVELAGLVGEKNNAKIILLAAASAKLARPLNVSVGGSSSAGKNYLIGTVARLIPEEDKKNLTGMSPKALMYAGEDEFQHKAVFIAEYEGVSGADYPIRTMQSEQVIEYEYVESTSNGIQKKTRQVKGPSAFIQATTRVTLHPENETRLLFLQMDESEEQTRAINKRQAQEAEKRGLACPPDRCPEWQILLRGLRARSVRIPFASQLAAALPGRVRSRRDLPKLLGLIEASAYLHQHRRQIDADGNIIAAWQDYHIAKELFEHSYYTGPESKVGELLRAAEKFGTDDFAVADLIRVTGWGKSKTYAVLARAEELGNIAEAEKHGRYRLIHNRLESPLNLPRKVKLSADDFRNSTRTPPSEFRISDFPSETVGESAGGTVEKQVHVSNKGLAETVA
jgi:hypothetical protein